MESLEDLIPIGATGSRQVRVIRELTVAHFHPHMPEVYSTPMMVLHMEDAASAAIQEHLPEGWVSVGVRVDITHLAATPVGAMVTATASVTAVDARTVTFHVEAHDGTDRIGEGTHVRAPIDIDRFRRRLAGKAPAPAADA
jgi:fluoroacetyl-CoA thioesterase